MLGIWSKLTYYECFPLVYELRKEENLAILWEVVTMPRLSKEPTSLNSAFCLLRNLIQDSEVILNYLLKMDMLKQLMIWQH